MSSYMKTVFCCVFAVLFALCMPAAAGAFVTVDPPMGKPQTLEINSRFVKLYEEAQEGRGIEENEPVTPGSGSICREAGYVDPNAQGTIEIGDDWTLTSTSWYSFTGTGGPVVIRIDGDWLFGMVVYQPAQEIPRAAEGLACSRLQDGLPGRIEMDTEAGSRYLIQVGDWKYFGFHVSGASYSLDLATPTPNKDRSHAIELPLGTPLQMSNFGGGFDSPPPTCSSSVRTYLGGRSAWAKVDIPSTGSLRVAIEPENIEPGSSAIINLYPQGGGTPLTCAVGPLNAAGNLTTELNARVAAGRYDVQLMTAVKSDENPATSAEEHWRVTAGFSPNLDIDGDGHSRPSDCDDNNAAVHPGAVDVPDDGIDENCDGQDARRDFDSDGVPDYRDRCPARSTNGVDKNHDGCADPPQLQLTAQTHLTFAGSLLRLSSLLVRTDPGARVVLACSDGACGGESKRVTSEQTQFGGTFRGRIQAGAAVSLAATEPGYVGVVKQYRLTTSGLNLRRQWCTTPGKAGKKVPCG